MSQTFREKMIALRELLTDRGFTVTISELEDDRALFRHGSTKNSPGLDNFGFAVWSDYRNPKRLVVTSRAYNPVEKSDHHYASIEKMSIGFDKESTPEKMARNITSRFLCDTHWNFCHDIAERYNSHLTHHQQTLDSTLRIQKVMDRQLTTDTILEGQRATIDSPWDRKLRLPNEYGFSNERIDGNRFYADRISMPIELAEVVIKALKVYLNNNEYPDRNYDIVKHVTVSENLEDNKKPSA